MIVRTEDEDARLQQTYADQLGRALRAVASIVEAADRDGFHVTLAVTGDNVLYAKVGGRYRDHYYSGSN